jgi:hypothetical protein
VLSDRQAGGRERWLDRHRLEASLERLRDTQRVGLGELGPFAFE